MSTWMFKRALLARPDLRDWWWRMPRKLAWGQVPHLSSRAQLGFPGAEFLLLSYAIKLLPVATIPISPCN